MQEPNLNIKLEQTEEMICEECQHNTFVQTFLMRKTNKVLTGQEQLIPIQVFECSACGHIMQDSLPIELKK